MMQLNKIHRIFEPNFDGMKAGLVEEGEGSPDDKNKGEGKGEGEGEGAPPKGEGEGEGKPKGEGAEGAGGNGEGEGDDNGEGKGEGKGEGQGDGKSKDDDAVEGIVFGLQEKFGVVAEKIEESPEGLVEYVEKLVKKVEEEAPVKYLNSKPPLASLDKHLNEGKSVDSWLMRQKAVDYSKVKITDKTEEQQLVDIIKADNKAKGLDDESIDIIIEGAKDKGILADRAKLSLGNLSKAQEQFIAAKEESERQALLKEQQEIQEEIKQVEAVISKGVLMNFALSKEDKDALRNYAYKPVDDKGRTQREIDGEEMGLEENMFLDFLMMKKFKGIDMRKILENAKGSKKDNFQQLQEDARKKKEIKSTGQGGNSGGNPQPRFRDITLGIGNL